MQQPESPKVHLSKRIGRNVFETPPKVSVVIPAYNAADYIVEALESVIGQKFREHEIIVVNDGSPDTEQLERALNLHIEDIIYIRQRNGGAGRARNTGIENARGEIIAFLDSDDVWMPDFLASQYVFLRRHDYDMVYCDAMLFGMRSAYRKTLMETAPSKGECNFDSLLDLSCNVVTSGTIARREAIIKAGMFENERVKAEDFHLWLRMAQTGAKIGYQKKALLKYRVHLESLSGDAITRVERSLDAFQRVGRTIDLTDEQRERLEDQIASFEADLAVEKGKALLLSGHYREAATEFQTANRYRRSAKLAAIGLMTRVAPKTLLKFYKSNRPSEIAFVPRQS